MNAHDYYASVQFPDLLEDGPVYHDLNDCALDLVEDGSTTRSTSKVLTRIAGILIRIAGILTRQTPTQPTY